jgi:hypothetical protein
LSQFRKVSSSPNYGESVSGALESD